MKDSWLEIPAGTRSDLVDACRREVTRARRVADNRLAILRRICNPTDGQRAEIPHAEERVARFDRALAALSRLPVD